MQESAERRRDTLMVRFVPWPGERMERECLRQPPPSQETVSFGYLGDLQLRLVFDAPGRGQPAAVRVEDLARLELTPQKAVAHAAANTKRENGPPQAMPLGGGVYSLRGHHLEYNAAVLLDRAFWRGQLEKFPQGLLAALPRKGVVLFAPAGEAEPELARQAASMLAAAGPQRISACIYRFDATGWHPHADLPQPRPKAAAQADPDENEDEDEAGAGADDEDLADAARGQRMLVFSILGSFVYNAIDQKAQPHFLVLLVLNLALTIYSLKGVLLLGSGLGRSTNAKIALMVLTCVPLANLVTWIVLSVQATRRLRAAGWTVGLLGAKP